LNLRRSASTAALKARGVVYQDNVLSKSFFNDVRI